MDTVDRPPDPWGAPVEPVESETVVLVLEEGLRLADAAVMVGVTDDLVRKVQTARRARAERREGPEEAQRHHSRAHGPVAVVEGPWHLTSHPCRPKYAEVNLRSWCRQCDLRHRTSS